MKCIQKEGIFFKAVAIVLAYIQFTTCAYAADITPDKTNGKNPGVTQAANGLTVVNIRTPNGHGLSHNQYKNLQVGAKGVIFNNSGQMSTTKLAGIIMGNYNLAGNSHAKVILNEVTGTNPTALNGYMEVAGNRAELIIANPNGISGNNFGYINTSRAVLTTGVPQITPDGRLDGFRVSQGEVSINGQGLDASTVDKTDILAQAVQVNAGIWAKDLNVVTGNNKIDYASGKVTGLSSENKGVSLDVAALGGMYANSIKLIGTAQGVGVNNAGQLSATAGTITINQNGDVINSGKLYSTGDMAVQSNSVDQAGTGITYTQSNLALNSGNITTNGVIKADKTININAANIKQAGDGDIEAGTLNIASSSLNNKGAIKNLNQSDMVINTGTLNTDNGSIESNGSVHINAGSYSGQQKGILYAKQEISLTAAGMLNNKNGIIQGGKSSIKAGSTIDNTNGQIVADTLDMSADNINNTKGSIKIIGKNSNATIAADADILNTTGAIKTNQELKLTAGHNIANGNGTISSADSLTAKADKLSGTAGQILSGGDLDLSLQKDVINTGSIEAQNNLTLTTNGTITNQKNILSNNSLTLTAANITNTSSAQIQSGKVNLTSRGTLTNSGLINGGSQTYITGNTVNNNDTGRIYGDHLAVQANNLNNIAVYGGASPVIAARNKMDLGIAGTITNKEHASLISGGNLYIGGSLDASHNAVNKAGSIENSSAYIKASGDSSIAAGTIHNSNNHFSTANTLISTTHYDKASGSGNFLYPFSGYGEPADHSQAYIIFGGKIQHLHTPDNGDYTSFNTYSYNEYIYQDVITQSDPAQIISGGSMDIAADTLINDKSSITAGKTLNAAVNNLQNIDGKGKQTVKDIGTATSYWIHHPRFKADDTHTSTTDYNPADIITDITVPAVTYTGGTIPYNIAKPDNNYSNIQMQNTATAAVNSIAIPTVDLRIPGSSLYSISKDVAANYIMETDPAYTNQQKFLSSDYFFQQKKQDPNYIQKRLGDGYYEEQLINDQVLELTGRRFLANYASDNEQYKALMDAAVKYAAADNTLKVGVALSKQQQANLKTDIVWMVETSVILPDGSVVKALVPQVYLAADADNTANGAAVISGENVNFKVTNDILNTGTIIAGDTAKLSATDINNFGGTIKGSNVAMAAEKDLNNTGTLTAGTSMELTAGRDLNVNSVTTTQTNKHGYTTNIKQAGSVNVTGDDGKISLAAKRDINLTAAIVASNGKNSSITVTAGRNANIDTVKTGSDNTTTWDSENKRHDNSSIDVGSSLTAKGNIAITAGQDITAKAAAIQTDKDISIAAGKNINITAGQQNNDIIENHKRTDSDILGSRTETTIDGLHMVQAKSTSIEGNTVSLSSGKDTNIIGSNIVGSGDVNITAQGNISIQSTKETNNELHYDKVQKSGFLSGGGIGFTIGKESSKELLQTANNEQLGSTVGSIDSSVNLKAGDKATIKGSDIIADKDINIQAGQVDIKNAENIYNTKEDYEYKKSGLSVSLGGMAAQNIANIAAPIKRAGQVKDNRLKALYAKKAIDEANSIKSTASKIKKDGIKAAVSIDVSIGSSKTESHTNSTTTQAVGSSLTTNGNVNIKADKTDINIIGSSVNADNITLKAKKDINLLAADNSNKTDSSSKSSSSSIGASFGLAGGITYTASVSNSSQKIKENGTTHTQTTITAKDTLKAQSGEDTNIIGAKASGNKVDMNVGRNLNIKTLQDTDTYDEQSHSAGIDLSIETKKIASDDKSGKTITEKNAGQHGSISKGSIDSNYQSSTEQAGIYAGKDGFNINVGKNTDLKGAVIASKATPEKNKLSTDTLTYSDVENKADYKADNKGINYTAGEGTARKDKGLTPDIGTPATGKASGKTKSAIAPGKIEIRSNPDQDIAKLNRDTKDALNKLGKIFDKEKVQERQELAKLFGEQAFKAVGDLAAKEYTKACADAVKAKKYGDDAAYQDAIKRKATWDTGGKNEVLLHTLVGGIMSDLGGNNFISGAVGAGIGELTEGRLKKLPDGMQKTASILVGAVAAKTLGGSAQAGAASSLSGTINNGLSHKQQLDFANDMLYAINTGSKLQIKLTILEYAGKSWWHSGDEYGENETIYLLNAAADVAGTSFRYNENDSLDNNIAMFTKELIYGSRPRTFSFQTVNINNADNGGVISAPVKGETLLAEGKVSSINWGKDGIARSVNDENGNSYNLDTPISRGNYEYQHGAEAIPDANTNTWYVEKNGLDYPVDALGTVGDYYAKLGYPVIQGNNGQNFTRAPDGSDWATNASVTNTNKNDSTDNNTIKKIKNNTVDFAAGVVNGLDDNMSFGLGKEAYNEITGHDPYTSDTTAYHIGKATADVFSIGAGTTIIGSSGIGTAVADGALSTTGVGTIAVPAITGTGIATVTYGAKAASNGVSDLMRYFKSDSGNAVTGKTGVNFAGKINTADISNMSKNELIGKLPSDWKVTENNGFVHVRDTEGNIRMRIDPPDKVTNYDHVHLYDEHGKPLDVNLNIVDRKSPKAHIPIAK